MEKQNNIEKKFGRITIGNLTYNAHFFVEKRDVGYGVFIELNAYNKKMAEDTILQVADEIREVEA